MSKMENPAEAPKDRFFITYFLFYGLGTVSLVPFHFFTTAIDYWMYKFRDPNSNESYKSENRTTLQAEFTADFTIVSQVTNAVFIVITIAFFLRRFTILTRIICALSGSFCMFVVTSIFVVIDTDAWQVGFMVVTFFIGGILTAFCGIFLVTIFEMTPKFPPSYLAVLFTGQSICGILSALMEIISLSVNEDPTSNGVVYFVSGTVFVGLTLLGFLASWKKSAFFKYHFTKDVRRTEFDVSKEKFLSILQKLRYNVATIFLCAGATQMMQPGITSLVLSVHANDGNANKWNDVYFGPVISFLVFSTTDYFGRELAIVLKKPSNGKILITASFIRLILIPLLLLCNAQPRDNLPVIFDNDYVYIILIIIFAWSHGFIMNLCIINAATIPTDEEKSLATFCLMIFVIVTLALWAFAGNGLVKAL